MHSKISIGTANFQKNYGFYNNSGIRDYELRKIVSSLNRKKIKDIDTAISYKNVDNLLGRSKIKNLKIYSKLPKLPKNCKNIKKWVNNQVRKSKNKLNIKKFEGFYFHNPSDLLLKQGAELYKNLERLKKNGIVNKIGISVYEFSMYEKINKNFKMDMIQIPLNILDRRINLKKISKIVKKQKVEIHVRSIFLQGILLKEKNQIPSYFRKWNKILSKWNKWCLENKLSKLQACINFVFNNKIADKIIIGIKNLKEFEEIIKCVEKKSKKYPKNIFSKDLGLIDPRRWPNAQKN